MRATLLRIALVVGLYFILFEIVMQLSTHWRESSGELAKAGVYALLVAGLIWASLPAFRRLGGRVIYRAGLVVSLFFVVHMLTYLYAWHIRVNVGLYQEPDWVARHPGFQKELRAHVAANRW